MPRASANACRRRAARRAGCVLFLSITAPTTLAGRGIAGPPPQEPPLLLRGHEAGIPRLAMSADGLWLASAGLDHTVRLWDPDSGEPERVFRDHSDEVYAVAFSPDGRWLASVADDRRLLVREVSTGELETEVADLPSWGLSVAFHPDGDELAVGGADGVTRRFAWPGVAPKGEHSGAGTVEAVAYHPSGRWLAAGGSGVRLLDPASKRVLRHFEGPGGKVSDLCFSPNGDLLAAVSYDRSVRIWETDSGDPVLERRCEVPVGAYGGREPFAEKPTIALPLTGVAFDPTGQRVAVAGAARAVWVWEVATGTCQHRITGFPRSVTGVTFGPDGESVFTACLDGVVRRHEL